MSSCSNILYSFFPLRLAGDSNWLTVATGIADCYYNVTDLPPGGAFKFRVACVNKAGQGPYSSCSAPVSLDPTGISPSWACRDKWDTIYCTCYELNTLVCHNISMHSNIVHVAMLCHFYLIKCLKKADYTDCIKRSYKWTAFFLLSSRGRARTSHLIYDLSKQFLSGLMDLVVSNHVIQYGIYFGNYGIVLNKIDKGAWYDFRPGKHEIEKIASLWVIESDSQSANC